MSADEKEPCLVENRTEDSELKTEEVERQPCLVNKHGSDEILNSVKSDDEIESCLNDNKSGCFDLDSVKSSDDEIESYDDVNKADIGEESPVKGVKSVDINDIAQDVKNLSCESIPESDCREIADNSESSDEGVQKTRRKKKVRFAYN